MIAQFWGDIQNQEFKTEKSDKKGLETTENFSEA